jgi:hypothetical protein
MDATLLDFRLLKLLERDSNRREAYGRRCSADEGL